MESCTCVCVSGFFQHCMWVIHVGFSWSFLVLYSVSLYEYITVWCLASSVESLNNATLHIFEWLHIPYLLVEWNCWDCRIWYAVFSFLGFPKFSLFFLFKIKILLTYNIVFQAYDIVIWYLCRLQNDHYSELTSITTKSYRFFFSCD